MNSVSNCFDQGNSYIMTFQNASQCYSYQSSQNSNSLFLLISPNPSCNTPALPLWEIIIIIVVASVFGIAIITLIIIFSVRSIRNKLFPRRGIRDGIKMKIMKDEETESKVETNKEQTNN